MSDVVIRVENLYKEYRLGTISHGTLYHDLQSWWARIRGKEDPNSIIGMEQNAKRKAADASPDVINTMHSALGPVRGNGHFLALSDVSFEVRRGEVLGIIGRNGAGKSTLLKILSEVTMPTKGTVRIKGRVASLLEVGTGFHPELTGRENVFLNGAILGMSKAEIALKFDEIVGFAEVEKFIDTPVKRYSSGMYVRLAFAVAAHLEPEILIVDEVLAVGDAQFQKKCLGKIGEVSNEGRTILLVSHNMRAIQLLCQKSLLLEKGILAEQGDTQQLIERYLSYRSGEVLPDKLDHVPRKAGLGNQIKFNKCFILNSKGEATNHLLFGEYFTIVIEAVAATTIDNISVIIGIDTAMEYRIATLASEDSQVLFNVAPRQLLRVHAQIAEMILKPGNYMISLGLRKGMSPIDHLPYIVRFEITEVPSEKSSVESNSWGVIHALALWTECSAAEKV